MHIERRRMIRRALAGGVLFAALSAVPLALIELGYVLLVRRPAFASATEALLFCLHLVLVLLASGAVLGLVQGPLVLGLSQLARLLARRRVAEPRWMAWLCSLLMLPGIAAVSAMTFAGRRAQLIPGKDWIAMGLGLAGLVLAYGAFRLIIGARDRFRIRRWGPRQAALLAPAVLLLAVLVYVADQRILARLYGFFHVGLALGAAGSCQLLVGLVYAAYRPRWRWISRLVDLRVALIFLLASVTAASWSLGSISRSETLRFLAFEHTAVQSKLLSVASAAGLTRGRPRPRVEPTTTDPPPSRMAGPRRPRSSVLLITVDALRADHMGAYGYTRSTTPNIDRFARGAVVFERAYCQIPHTSYSIASLMTGSYLHARHQINPHHHPPTLARAARRYGLKTAAFFPPAVFYIDRQSFGGYEKSRFNFEYVKYEYLGAGRRVDQVLDFLRRHRGRQVFVWAHFFEPHEPYVRHSGFDFGPHAVDRYDGEIAYVDHHLGRLLVYVQQQRPDTIVALTADHGEEFGEHGGHYHGNALYEQQVRVPLMISVPGLEGRRVAGAAQVIDLPVTLLSMLDLPVPAEMRGTDLGPWLAGEDPRTLPPAFSELRKKKMVVRGQRKLICDTARDYCELYDLGQDPGERNNLVARQAASADRLRAELQRWTASHVPAAGEEQDAGALRLLERAAQGDRGAVKGLTGLLLGPLELRRRAARALALLQAPAAREALLRAASDKDPGTALPAQIGAALLGDGENLERMHDLLQRPDLPPTLRRDALLALAASGDRQATRPLATVLARTRALSWRVAIIEALGKLGDPEAAPELMQQLTTLRTRLAAIRALGQVRARSAVPALCRGLLQDRFISWRQAAARALGQIGDPSAIRPLQQAVRRDLEAAVVTEALAALGKLGGLPVPGTRPLSTGRGWDCDAGVCTLRAGVSCAAAGAEELLVLLDPAPRQPRLELLCGSGKPLVANATPGGGALAPLSGAGGWLRLMVRGQPPAVRHLALRQVPAQGSPSPK
jgi:HEAT repeat protein